MKVTLIAHTPNPENVVATAAKLCYSSKTLTELYDETINKDNEKYLNKLAELGHTSPLEHATFTFGIEGVSRALLAQITRHRIASYSVQSQRYVNLKQFEFVTPPEVAADEETLEKFNESMDAACENYMKVTEVLKAAHKARMIAEGMDEKAANKAAEKQAIEDARFILPNACTTKMIVTMNARSLNNFFAHRCCMRAQWEIRELADEMLKLCLEVAPTLFGKAGASCMYGSCSEGAMCCGHPRKAEEYAR